MTTLLVIGLLLVVLCVVLPAADDGSQAPVEPASVDAASVDAASVDAASVDAASVDAASVDAVSVDAVSVDAVSVDAVSVDPSATPVASDGFGGIVFDSMAEGLVVADRAARLLLMNRRAELILGGDLRALPIVDWSSRLGICLHDGETLCPASDFPLLRALRGESVSEVELFLPTGHEGRGTWITGGAQPVLDDDGRPQGAVMVFRDVTTRRRTEEALEEARIHRQVIHGRETAISEIEMSIPESRRLQALLDRVGDVTQELLRTRGVHVAICDPEVQALLSGDGAVVLPRAPGFDPPAAALAWIIEKAQPFAVADVADDPFAARELAAQGVAAYAGTPLIDDGNVVGVLFAWCDEARHFPQEDLDVMSAIAQRTATCITKVRLYERLRGLNVSLERRTAELRENEERFRTLADTAPVLIWMSGPDGGLNYVNRFWRDFTGRSLEDETGNGWIEGVHSEDRGRCLAVHEHAFANRTPFRLEVRLRRADGAYRWLLTTGTPRVGPDGRFLGFIGSSIDISDHREVQAELARHRAHLEGLVRDRTNELEATHRQLRQADRLASIGTLTAGLGHDMNNVLFPVRCRLDALRWESVPAELMDLLQSVAHAVTYLQQLTDGLRLFALDPDDAEASATLTDLSEWWGQVSPLLTKALPTHVTLESDLESALPQVRVAPHRLTQALLNLVVNAGEAMPNGGRVQIRADAADDDRVRISVKDEGQGMTPQVRLQAFDPFFTTKTRGLSTGLGLSLVHGVVSSSRGTIDVDTAPGAGTTVILCFPAAEPTAVVVAPDRGAPRVAAIDVTNGHLAAWVRSLLETAGYAVAANGRSESSDTLIWVTDAAPAQVEPARRFLADRRDRRVIAIGQNTREWDDVGAIVVKHANELDGIRAAIDLAGETPG